MSGTPTSNPSACTPKNVKSCRLNPHEQFVRTHALKSIEPCRQDSHEHPGAYTPSKTSNLADRIPVSLRAHTRLKTRGTLQIELDVTMAELAQAQETLKETLDKVATLEAQFDEANTKKVGRRVLYSIGVRGTVQYIAVPFFGQPLYR